MRKRRGPVVTQKCRATSPNKLMCGLPKDHFGVHQAFGTGSDGQRKVLEQWSKSGRHQPENGAKR